MGVFSRAVRCASRAEWCDLEGGDRRGDGRTLVEALEERCLLATFAVTNLNDAGAGSLRAAILSANALAGADIVEFQEGLSGTITLTTGQLAISDSLEINGPGAGKLTIANGSGASRVLAFMSGTSTLLGVTVTGGSLPAGVQSGAGVYNAAVLTVDRVAITSNTAGSKGGGLYNQGAMTVIGSTFYGNKGGLGGAIYNASSMTVTNSTFSGNQGIGGGGIYSNSFITVRNSTIAANAGGRGIFIDGGTGVLISTIVAGNTGGDVQGTFSAGSTNNLIKDAFNTGGLTNGASGNLIGVDPLLSPIASNGGPTRTMALQAGSPAIGQGSNPASLTTDQRFGPFVRGTAVDIGAYQRQILTLVVDTTVDEDDGNYASGDLSLREAIAAAGPNPGNDTIRFGFGTTIPRTLTLGSTELEVAGDLTISGPGSDRITIEGGGARVFNFSAGTSVLSGVQVRSGKTTGSGGGIYNAGNLTISNVSMSLNESDGAGAAIYNTGTLVVSGSWFFQNHAVGNAGAIASTGPLTISNSSIVRNLGAQVGGIWSSGVLVISNSTISKNSGLNGDGVFASGTTTVRNSTIAENDGRGIVVSGATIVQSSIISGNDGGEVQGTLAAGSTNNLVENSASSGGLINGVDGNIVGVNPQLGLLSSNGGLGESRALEATSPAIGKGINPAGLTTDQRGGLFSRGTAVDIGAYQRQSFNLVVDTLSDVVNEDFGPGNLSLREAIDAAGPNPGNDTITFASALNNGTIRLSGRALRVLGDLTITGPGAGLLTINGDDSSAVFTVNAVAFLQGLTIKNGSAGSGSGGGIWNDGVLTISDTTISANVAYRGGGIYNEGVLTVQRSTISGNSSVNDGGGVYSDSSSEITITNSTISGNSVSSSGEGGGVHVRKFATVLIRNSTIAGNTSGGGLDISGADVTLVSTIVAGNTGGDIRGDVLAESTNNLVQDPVDNGGLANNVNGNIVGVDPLLGPLANNGGTTSTMALLAGSPAINKGLNPAGLSVDQRGAGFARVRGGGIDIGAYDFNAAPVLTTFTPDRPQAIQGETLGFGSTGTDDGAIASVSYFLDANTNGVPDEGELLATSSGQPGLSVTLDGIQTSAIPAGTAQLLARATDADGAVSNVLTESMTVLFGVRAGAAKLVSGAASAGDESRVVTVTSGGHVIVFEAGWSVVDLQLKTGAPPATGDAVIWLDPKDQNIYVAAPSAQGLLLFSGSGGAWTFRNLTTETAASSSPTQGLAQITSVNNTVVLAGLTAGGRIVGFQQTLTSNSGGQPEFKFIDISADLDAQGMTTPALSSLIGYVTTWDAWNLAGIDSNGKVQVVWIVPATFSAWRTDDLSAITGAPAMQGQLAVTLTGWGGINLSGLSAAGSLLTTWWVPSFGGVWQVNDLTAQFNGAPLSGGKVSGYTTPWGGLNYVGLAGDGTVMVYWWTPGLTDWNVSPLLPDTTPSDQRPTGTLTSSSSAAGTLNVYGASATGEALRMWWNPSGAATWSVDNVSVLAQRA